MVRQAGREAGRRSRQGRKGKGREPSEGQEKGREGERGVKGKRREGTVSRQPKPLTQNGTYIADGSAP